MCDGRERITAREKELTEDVEYLERGLDKAVEYLQGVVSCYKAGQLSNLHFIVAGIEGFLAARGEEY